MIPAPIATTLRNPFSGSFASACREIKRARKHVNRHRGAHPVVEGVLALLERAVMLLRQGGGTL